MRKYILLTVTLFIIGIAPVLIGLYIQTSNQEYLTESVPKKTDVKAVPEESVDLSDVLTDTERELLQQRIDRLSQGDTIAPSEPRTVMGLGVGGWVSAVGTMNSMVVGWVMVYIHIRQRRRKVRDGPRIKPDSD